MLKKKVKRYAGNDESLVDSDYAYDPISKIIGEAEIKRAAADDSVKYKEDQPSTGLKKETFGEAFKRNKARGAKTFEFAGKKYSTESKEQKAARTKPVPDEDEAVASARSIAQGDKWREEQKAKKNIGADKVKSVPRATESDLKKRAAQEAEQALITLNPETLLPVGRVARVLQGVSTGAKSMNRKDRVEPYDTKSWRNERDITPEQPKIGVNAPRITVDRPKLGMKKGGAVKSFRATKSSASSRGDGIAQRGKTKGRMV